MFFQFNLLPEGRRTHIQRSELLISVPRPWTETESAESPEHSWIFICTQPLSHPRTLCKWENTSGEKKHKTIAGQICVRLGKWGSFTVCDSYQGCQVLGSRFFQHRTKRPETIPKCPLLEKRDTFSFFFFFIFVFVRETASPWCTSISNVRYRKCTF